MSKRPRASKPARESGPDRRGDRHDRDRPDAWSIGRLATRGLLVTYFVAVAAIAGVASLVTTGAVLLDPVEEQVVVIALIAAVAALTLLLMFVSRTVRTRSGRIAGELSELRAAYDRARLDSLADGLTGLDNHRGFLETLEARMAAARMSKAPLALLLLDVDELRRTNERRGHAAGDETLRTVAQILRSSARPGDQAFRIGGDEFAVVLPGCDLDEAEAQANQILAAALSGNHGGGDVSLTIGCSAFPVPSGERQPLVIHAEAALAAGKRRGQGVAERFDPSRHGIAEDARTLVELELSVQEVAEGDVLRPVYQPIYSLATGEVIGFEGLVRLAPDAPFGDPASLFVAAEATRRNIEIDVVAATTVLAGADGLRPTDQLSINLSPRTLGSEAFSPLEIVTLARRHGIAPTQLVVELTEREEVEDLARLRAAIATLRRNGVRVAIDDVGAGNAGRRLLGSIEVDIMKIDLSLVRAGASHEPSEAVLRAMRRLAEEHGRRIVAERIETSEQLEAVLELRFHAAQGFLLGRPGPALSTEPVPLLDLVTDEGAMAPAV